jgi:parallel beta-helix repeat protein
MTKCVVLILLIFASLLVCVLPITNAQSSQPIIINGNGVVTPADAAIQMVGNTYTVTADIIGSIVVEANNIILDGANHTLQGPGIYPIKMGMNLTAANVTVINFQITNWHVGILGAWNNNTIANNGFRNNYQAIAIYADDYVVCQNSFSNNSIGVFVDGGAFRSQGDNNFVSQNQLINNGVAFDVMNSDGTTITQNNVTNNRYILKLATNTRHTTLYRNNFVDNQEALIIPFGGPTLKDIVAFSPAGQWDNGTVGNYWSDYQTKYFNATEIGQTATGNIPYEITSTLPFSTSENGIDESGIVVLGTAIDNHPLMAPTTISTTPGVKSTNPSPSIPELPIAIALISPLVATGAVALFALRNKKT